MASIISAGTTSGTSLNLSGDTSGVLQLATNGSTTAITVDTSQNVGIGTSSPQGKLDVSSGSAGVTAGDLVVDTANKTVYVGRQSSTGGDNSYLVVRGRLNGSGTNQAIVITGDTTAYGTGIFRPNNDNIGFSTLATERMRILSTGNILSLAGGSTTATGTGIAFPATQSASSDANTLDDYEEGSWTPVLTDLTNNATMTSTVGRYIKIGRTVSLQAQVQTSSLGSVSGNIYISGLPFQAESTAGNYAGSVAGNAGNLAITANQSVSLITDPGATFLQLFLWDDAAGSTRMQATEWSSDGLIRFSITYFSAS